MTRLPPILLAGRSCSLPLSEPTASVLLWTLLGGSNGSNHAPASPGAIETRGALIEALALDPALALWTALQHAGSASADSAPPSIAELAEFLAQRLAAITSDSAGEMITPEALTPKKTRVQKSRVVEDPLSAFAKLATSAVLAAQLAAPAARSISDPRYLSALLQDAGDWLGQAGMATAPLDSLPGWLGRLFVAPPATTARKNATKSRGKSAARQGHGVPNPTQRPRARTAGDRWLAPAGIASRQFALLATRLLRLADLETNFAERLLEEKLHALGEFAAGAGHEINNPLAVISGRAQLFLRHESDPERRRELAVINTQARRVHEMIADLMLFARPPEPRPAPCDIPSLVGAVIAELTPRAAERTISLRSRAAAEPIAPLAADATQLQVALRAVIENAIDAATDGGTVEVAIELREDVTTNDEQRDGAAAPARAGMITAGVAVGRVATNRQVAITVRDDGLGFDAAARRNLFDPFYSGRGAGRGVGMGLSKCWRIVTSHGGRVEIDNHPTGGACVTILLPIAIES